MRHILMFPMRAAKHWNRWCEGATIGDVARLTEEDGFDAFSMSEYPYPDNEWLASGGHHAFDPFVSLSFDQRSGGRFTLGTSARCLKSEFDALGVDFDGRGALLDEAMAAWKATWTDVDHDGPDYAVSGHIAQPPPLTNGGPTIWIGGGGKPAQTSRRRGGRRLDADGRYRHDGCDHPDPSTGIRCDAERVDHGGEEAAFRDRSRPPTSPSSPSRWRCSPVVAAVASPTPSNRNWMPMPTRASRGSPSSRPRSSSTDEVRAS